MQSDLFTDSDPAEEWYALRLSETVAQEEKHRIESGIIPPWIEADNLLAKDERRLLKLVADAAGYCMIDGDYVVTPYGMHGARRVSQFTVDMEMLAEANSKAVLNAAVARGLVTVTLDKDLPGCRIDMTRRGQYYLNLCEDDNYCGLED